jgi:hypothetical protein
MPAASQCAFLCCCAATFSTTPRPSTLLCLLALQDLFNWNLEQPLVRS